MHAVDHSGIGRYVPQPDIAGFVAGVFLRAAGAMVAAGGAAAIVAYNPRVWPVLHADGPTWRGWLVILAPLALAMTLDRFVERLTVEGARVMLVAWSIALGASLATIVRAVAGVDFVAAFFATAAGFAMLAFIGTATHARMGRGGMAGVAGVVGALAAALMTLLLRADALEIAVAALGVGVFSGLAVVDLRRIERLYEGGLATPAADRRLAMIGALTLSLDLVNLLLSLLRLTARRR